MASQPPPSPSSSKLVQGFNHHSYRVWYTSGERLSFYHHLSFSLVCHGQLVDNLPYHQQPFFIFSRQSLLVLSNHGGDYHGEGTGTVPEPGRHIKPHECTVGEHRFHSSFVDNGGWATSDKHTRLLSCWSTITGRRSRKNDHREIHSNVFQSLFS